MPADVSADADTWDPDTGIIRPRAPTERLLRRQAGWIGLTVGDDDDRYQAAEARNFTPSAAMTR